MPISNVYNLDCQIGMKQFPDKFFDLACVDPPYGIDYLHAGGMCKKNGWVQHERKDWDKATPNANYFIELKRVSKNQIIWGGNYFDLGPSQYIIWDKGQRDFTLADAELAWSSFDRAIRVFDYARAKSNSDDRIPPHPEANSPIQMALKELRQTRG